jgi:hypothetical protein
VPISDIGRQNQIDQFSIVVGGQNLGVGGMEGGIGHCRHPEWLR